MTTHAGQLFTRFGLLATSGLAVACGGGGAAVTAATAEPSFHSLELTPASAAVTLGGTLQLGVVARDEHGNSLLGLPSPTFTSSQPTTAEVDASGLVTGRQPGNAVIRAEVNARGVARSATSTVTVTEPIQTGAVITTPDRTYSPATVTLAAGGTVTWQILDRRHNVTFTGPAPPGGNIPDIQEGNTVARTFPAPGRYDFECTRHRERGMRGSILVVATASPRFSSLSLVPTTASVAVGGSIQLTATPLDQNGSPMQGLPASTFVSSDPSRATVDAGGQVRGIAEGTATVTASLTTEGTTHLASATINVGGAGGAPGSATVTTPGSSFSPATVTIAAGGTVTWQFSGARHNVVFRGATPPGGNIPDTEAGNSVSRTFPAAGTFDYDCTRHSGMIGRVVVQ